MLKKLLKIFHSISEIIATNSNHEVILSKFVKILAEGLEVDVCTVYLFDPERNVLVLKATEGLNPDSIDKVCMKTDEGLTGLSFTSGRTINIINPERHSKFKYFVGTGEEKYKSFLATPVVIGKERLGVIVIQSIKQKRFSKSVSDSVKSVSTQLANVIVDTQVIYSLLENKPRTDDTVLSDKKSSFSLKGRAANIGIGMGHACIFDTGNYFDKIFHKETDDVASELEILKKAIKITKEKTVLIEQKALDLISEADASIFYAHLLFLDDKTLISKIKEDIEKNRYTAEFAIKQAFSEYSELFVSLQENIFKEKIMDLKDVLFRLIETIRNIKKGRIQDDLSLNLCNTNAVLIVKEILPSDLIRMPLDSVTGIVCERGGVADHVAILAKALNIPAIRGIKNITEIVGEGDEIIVDGHSEFVHIRPEEKIKDKFIKILEEEKISEPFMDEDITTVTKDGVKFFVKANIALINEIALLKKYGAEGIGLYRTEFLYMIRDHEPTEDDQFNIFKKVFKRTEGMDITIRVLDIGGDKALPYINAAKEDNPALGNRGIRLLLSNKAIFKTHLKAILRAGKYGNLKILFPMISSPKEIDEVYEVINEVETELQFQNIDYSDDYEIGAMIEVPSILFQIDSIIDKVDFFSLGTNDLVQYLFASDRTNDVVYDKNQYFSPIFLKIIMDLGDNISNEHKKKLSACGEMAGDLYAVPFLVGAGIQDLSMPPRFIPAVRNLIKSVNYDECRKLLEKAVKMNNCDEVFAMTERFCKKSLLSG